jgi:site-specific DNA-methyltransferase (adenine-specific)
MTAEKKRKRKNPYIPHVAASRFKPTEDWTRTEALDAYKSAKFPFGVDLVHYEDCISGMENLPAESIDVIIADPPFGISFNGKESIYNRDESLVVKGYREVEGDYSDFTHAWVSKLPRLLKKTGAAWIFSGWTNLAAVLNAIDSTTLSLVNHIIWQYQFGVFTRRKFVSSHYHLLFIVKDTKKYYFNKIQHYPLDVWDIKRTYLKGELKNGTKLPENLVMRCIDFTSRPGNIVLDPFMGNATTATAAKGSYRHYLGFESNPEMRQIIENNLKLVGLGEFYIPYSERKDELVEMAKKKHGVSDEENKLHQTRLI